MQSKLECCDFDHTSDSQPAEVLETCSQISPQSSVSKICEGSLQSRKVFTPDFNYSLYILCFLLQSNEIVQCCLVIVHGNGVKMAWSRALKRTTVRQARMLIYLFNLLLIYLISLCSDKTLWQKTYQQSTGRFSPCLSVPRSSVCQRHYFLFQFTKSEKKIMPSSSVHCTSQSSLNIKIHSQEFLLGVITVINVLQCQPFVYTSITVAFSLTARSLHRCSLF